MNQSLTIFQRLLLAVILMEIPLQLDVNLDYHEAEAAYGALGGWNVSLTTACLCVLYPAWLVTAALQKTRNDRWWPRGVLPGLVYLATMALSVVLALRPLLSLFELFYMLQAFLIFLYLFRWIRSSKDVGFVVTWLMAGLALQGLCMLGLYLTKQSVHVAGIFARVDPGGRVGGTIGSPNDAASYLMLLLPLALSVILGGWGRWSRLLAGVAFILGFIALITTQSRGGLVFTVLGLGIVMAAALVRGRISVLIPVAVGLAGVIVAFAFQDVIFARFTKDDNGSAYARVTLMQVAMRVVEDSPILGSGANNMAVVMKPYAHSSDFRGTWGYVTHNRYLQVWAETGIVGLAAWLAFLGTALWRGWQCWRADDRILSPLALGAVMGIVGVVMYMCVEVFCGRSQMYMLWILAALTAAMYRMTVYQSGTSPATLSSLHSMSRAQHETGALAGAAQA